MGMMDWVGAAKLTQDAQPTKPVNLMEINNAANDPDTIKNVLAGAKTGAGAGSSFGPYGTLIGGAAGAIGGGLESAHSHENDEGMQGPNLMAYGQGLKDNIQGIQGGIQQGQEAYSAIQGADSASAANDANNLSQMSSMGDVLSDKNTKQNIKASKGVLDTLRQRLGEYNGR